MDLRLFTTADQWLIKLYRGGLKGKRLKYEAVVSHPHLFGAREKVVDSLKARIRDTELAERDHGSARAEGDRRRDARQQGVESSRMFYPGYVLVDRVRRQRQDPRQRLSPDQGDAKGDGFVGGQNPTPLTQDEVDQIVHNVTRSRPRSRNRSSRTRRARPCGSSRGRSQLYRQGRRR